MLMHSGGDLAKDFAQGFTIVKGRALQELAPIDSGYVLFYELPRGRVE
jgi:hypothetical protein